MTVGSDSFVGATVLAYGTTSDPTPTAALTTEVDEPDLYGIGSNLRSAWWKFTAPATETVGLDLLSSVITGDPDDTDPIIVVWTGTDLASLTYVADGDDNDHPSDPDTGEVVVGRWLTEMDFDATEGVTYFIQVLLYDYSADTQYRLRMGKRVVTYSDWVQPDDYEVDWTGNLTPAISSGRQISSSGNFTAGTTSSGMNDALQAGLADTVDVTTVDPDFDGSVQGMFVAFADPDPPYDWSLDIFTRAQLFQADSTTRWGPSNGISPYDPDSVDVEYDNDAGNAYGEVLHANLQGFWGFLDPRTLDGPVDPPLHGTMGLKVVDWSAFDSALAGDLASWDLSDSVLVDDAAFVSDVVGASNPAWEIDFDLAPYMNPNDAYFLLLQNHPGTFTDTWDFAAAFNESLQDRMNLIGLTDIHYEIHPAAYRYVFWDIEEGPTGEITANLNLPRTRFFRKPRR